jgi:hypothetical protein
METAIHRRVLRLRANEDASLIARLASGWAVLGEQQLLRKAHPWSYDWDAAPGFDAARDAALLLEIRQALRSYQSLAGPGMQ